MPFIVYQSLDFSFNIYLYVNLKNVKRLPLKKVTWNFNFKTLHLFSKVPLRIIIVYFCVSNFVLKQVIVVTEIFKNIIGQLEKELRE